MASLLELLRENKNEELWQRCCGFTDLNMDQFMTIQKQLLMEQIEYQVHRKYLYQSNRGSLQPL